MPADKFICGNCQTNFSEIDDFVLHKKNGCQSITDINKTTELSENMIPLDLETVEGTVVPSDQQTVIIIQPCTSSGDSEALTAESILQGAFANTDGQTTLITDQNPELLMQELAGHVQMTTSTEQQQHNNTLIAVKKPRGRPKQKKTQVKTEPPVGKPSHPEIGADGRFLCTSCKRSFTKERFFNTHKCLGGTDYIDLTKKEALDMDLEIGDDDEDRALNEKEEEFIVEDEEEYKQPDSVEKSDVSFSQLSGQDTQNVKDGIDNVQVSTDPDVENALETDRPTDAIDDLPIFTTEEEKLKFEQNLYVDLSVVDNMFKQHTIEQDLNDKAPMSARMITNSLSLYSCNVCEKIFKTLSHMRLHCLIHTDLRPFKCPKCDYTSNSKGNLYTHMRKHTGQYYRCTECKFKSVNKSHLLEHVATHDKVQHKCEICLKTYKTVKSLVNHVRKYHGKSGKGKAYLNSFQQNRQTKGATVIHQCHVCNRKFKKKVDRDRHLFVHDIKDIPNIQHCELCDYTASRKVYLDKHYQKHRVIYRCVQCDEKYLSTVRLIDHLTNVHLKDDAASKWDELFEQCINYSVYLPEPDDTLTDTLKEYVNLPPELSSSILKGGEGKSDMDTDKTVGSDLMGENVVYLENDMGKDVEITSQSVLETVTTLDQRTDSLNNDETSQESQGQEAVQSTEGKITQAEKSFEDADSANNISNISILPQQPEQRDIRKNVSTTGKEKEENANETSEVSTTQLAGVNAKTSSQKSPNNTVNTETLQVTDVMENFVDGMELREVDYINDQEDASGNDKDIIKRLGYHAMTMDIFHKMRETFGHEECEYCGKLYYSKVDFDTHLRTHTGDKPFPCTICGYRGLTKENLNRHKEREHEKLTFPCTECDFVANSRSQLWNHTMKHRGLLEEMGIECPTCKSKFENMKKLKTHFNIDHADLELDEQLKITGGKEIKHKAQGKMGRRSYKCPYCDKVFIRANSELQKHIWIHEGIKPYKCPLCPHACRSKNNLQAHMLRHSNEKPYLCTECGKAYKSQTALRWHVRSHKDGKLFKCNRCPYEASQRSHLKRHVETHDVVKRFICMHCDYSANTIGYLKIHYSRHHKGQEFNPNLMEPKKVVMVDSQAYRCLSCDYLFGNLSDLKRHLKIRHHLQVEQIQKLKRVPVSQVQVLQCSEDGLVEQMEDEEATQVIEATQTIQTSDQSELDENTVSAVNILQQIIDMSQQGTLGQHPFTVQAEDGQLVTVNPETIIVQQEGEEVLVTDSNGASIEDGNQQFVIQYVTPEEGQLDQASMVEVQTVPMGEAMTQSIAVDISEQEPMDQT